MQQNDFIARLFCQTLLFLLFAAAPALAQPAAWAANTAYAVNALVGYNNQTYKCLQAHTSQIGWEPPNAQTLWQLQSSSSGGANVIAGQPFPARVFAPYVDVLLYPTFPLAGTAADINVKHFSLGFVTAGNGCQARWGGVINPAEDFLVADMNALRAAGGNFIVSFGGAAGVELAEACPSVEALQAQYQAVIDRYNLTHIDLDIEGGALSNQTANDRRNRAVARLQAVAASRNRQLVVSYTLPVLTTGLTNSGVNLLHNAVANNVNVAIVNVMAMDYGNADPNRMGQNAIDAANSTAAQLQNVFPNRTPGELRRMIGVTPMIGLNDVAPEVFTLADAQLLLDYAGAQNIGRLAMWSMTRDKQCAGAAQVSPVCSGISQSPFAFANRFKAFTSAAALPPAPVCISGRITGAPNKGLRNALVALTNTRTNETRRAITNPFGYYRFANVQTNENYTISISAKRFAFAAQTLTINQEMNNLDFAAAP